MTNDGADTAVIQRIVAVRIKKWRLQDPGGENNLVLLGIVICIDRRRSHVPLAAVDGFADLGQIAIELVHVPAQAICYVRPALNAKRRVVLPFIGVADFGGESRELRQRRRAGFRAHPRQCREITAKCSDEVIYHLQRFRLGVCGKMLGYIDLSERKP